ncbi:MAG: hypothetical protein EPN92_04925 [Chitinophagaceae bacterium]|nr:MAG: hypothetical protein EPN92_04925 [Chitinophagaceae bacterium]
MKRTKMYMVLLLQFLLFLLSCSKEKLSDPVTTTSSTPLTNANATGEVFKNQTWQSNSPYGTGLWCLQSVGGDIFVRHPYSDNQRYESEYYANHVRIYIKSSYVDVWQAVPFVPKDYYGVTNYGFYFTDDNYVVSLPGLGTFIAPRILIIAKPDAPIDFLKPFDVKFVFV